MFVGRHHVAIVAMFALSSSLLGCWDVIGSDLDPTKADDATVATDTAADTLSDDVTSDVVIDVGSDAPPDTDATTDDVMDSASDTGVDSGADSALDSPMDSALDSGMDSGLDAPDVMLDAPGDTKPDTFESHFVCGSAQCTAGVDKCCSTDNGGPPDYCFGGPDAATTCDGAGTTTMVSECQSHKDCDAVGKTGQVCCGKNRFVAPANLTMWSVVQCLPKEDCAGATDDELCDDSIATPCLLSKKTCTYYNLANRRICQ